ncbi:hypothetical protein [Streptomyces sp. 5-10]|uniref:hypothetical protein n=1 Tax=Streptomyces sp. 5-10 TaxID=878925 RepID=UPI00168B232C|nr:hypothetical protein [Streptomyces sp. 5-10]MBD3006420.1 hypothetical protein [Streptomyces sp. 5-10]
MPTDQLAEIYQKACLTRLHGVHVLLFNIGQVPEPPFHGLKTAELWRTELLPPGHRNAQMPATYSHINDPVLKEQYEKVIAAGGRIAGPAAEELLSRRIGEDTLNWLKTNFFKTELELGHCLRAPAEGPCECDLYLRSSKFLTTSEYAPRLRSRLAREHQLAQDAVERGWPREVERHNAIADRIRSLLADLGESAELGPDDHC